MLEQELRNALQHAKPEPPTGFDARSDAQIARLLLEEKNMKKKIPALVLVMALVIILGMATALAAGLLNWNNALKDSLQVTDKVQEQYEQTDLVDFPKKSVTQNGVTVTLDQCIVDTNAAYMAFRVSGYTPPKGVQPAFDKVDYGMPINAGSSFYDYAEDGRPYKGGYDLPYADKNGDLTYIISAHSPNESFIGKKMKITLGDLGTYGNKAGDVKVDVPGTWVFEWTLRGTDKRLDYANLDTPIGKTGATLKNVHLSPIYIKMEMTLPRNPVWQEEDEPYDHAPYLIGMKMKDGTVYRYITDGGAEGYADEKGDTYHQAWELTRIITPSEVESLLFTHPITGSDKVFEVKISK